MAKRKVVGYFDNEARKDRRYEFPLRVTIASAEYATLDWGFGGFSIAGYEGELRRENEFTITRIARAATEGTPVRVTAEVIHYNPGAK